MAVTAIYEKFIGQEMYTKREHGSRLVRLKKKGQKVVFEMEGEEYLSAYQFFSTLYGKKTRMSFQQYFRWTNDAQPEFDPIAELHRVSTAHLGIDLENRSHEVRKLFYAGFGRQCYAAGYDPEDVLQEIYRGILARNKGICPFDASKSSFGHYVHMVCGCIVANYHRKMNKLKEREQVGIMGFDENGNKAFVDVSSAAIEDYYTSPQNATEEEVARKSLAKFIREHGKNLEPILDMLLLGMSRKEISESLQVEPKEISARIKRVRQLTRTFFDGQ